MVNAGTVDNFVTLCIIKCAVVWEEMVPTCKTSFLIKSQDVSQPNRFSIEYNNGLQGR